MTTLLAVAALLVALVALGVALLAFRRADDAQARPAGVHRQPLVDERRANLGAPRQTGERRSLDLGREARTDPDDTATRELRIPPSRPGGGLPPPGQIGRPRP